MNIIIVYKHSKVALCLERYKANQNLTKHSS